MQVTHHPTPRLRDVVREQVRVVGLSVRREALVAVIVLGVVTIVIAADIVRGTAQTWFDSDDWYPIGITAFLFPFLVWRGERRFGPAFLWTLPVDRRRLTLAKVLGGWVWLMVAVAIFISWETLLAILSGVPGARAVALESVGGATSLYLFGSALVLGLRVPLRWLFGTIAVILLLGMFDDPLSRVGAGDLLASVLHGSGVEAAATQWANLPHLMRLILGSVLWIVAGLAALLAAVARHRERRPQ